MIDHCDDPKVKSTSDEVEDDGAMRRRDILADMGRFAYAAPALALLARPRAAQADYGGTRGGAREGGGSAEGRG